MRKNSEKYKMNEPTCPSFTNVATVKAWRRLRRSATRRPSKFYFNRIVSTQYKDVSHAAALVDEDIHSTFSGCRSSEVEMEN